MIEIFGYHEKTLKPRIYKRPRPVPPQVLSGDKQLTLYELGALIVVAGTEAGFDVVTEHDVGLGEITPGDAPRTGKIDCAWYSKHSERKHMLVAWELDAQDVGKGHLEGSDRTDGRIGNRRKFDASNAMIKVQALYSIRGYLLGEKEDAGICFPVGGPVRLLRDVDLMGTELLKIVEEAKAIDERIRGVPPRDA